MALEPGDLAGRDDDQPSPPGRALSPHRLLPMPLTFHANSAEPLLQELAHQEEDFDEDGSGHRAHCNFGTFDVAS